MGAGALTTATQQQLREVVLALPRVDRENLKEALQRLDGDASGNLCSDLREYFKKQYRLGGEFCHEEYE